MMKMSAAGRAALMVREGVVLKAYRDSVGVLTIGVGHTGRASPPLVTPSMTISRVQADQYLALDLAPMETAVNGAIKVPMTQNQFDACVSLAFNIGAGGFTGSTVVHKFNAGDVMGAADAFLMWEKPAVLRQRRNSERAQFQLSGPAEVDAPPVQPTPHPAIVVPAKPPETFLEWLRSIF